MKQLPCGLPDGVKGRSPSDLVKIVLSQGFGPLSLEEIALQVWCRFSAILTHKEVAVALGELKISGVSIGSLDRAGVTIFIIGECKPPKSPCQCPHGVENCPL